MSIKQKLELARLELLDMGLRGNPLLHVPKSSKYLDIVEERSEDIFRLLVEEHKSMSFLPLPDIYDPSAEHQDEDNDQVEALPSLGEYLAESAGADRFSDRFLQTRLPGKSLDTRLLKIDVEAHSLLQEQGIDVLYLALVFLEWYEDPNAKTPRFAPLILVPVEMQRESARTGFTITYTEADLGPNLTLATRLKGDFRVELPGFDEELDPTAYIAKATQAIASQPRWRIHENRIGLGLFSFGKFQMYVDLEPANWPEDCSILDNSQIERVFETGFQRDAELLENSVQDDQLSAPETVHLVKDADSSQLGALLAVMHGANLVVQGPPGTGKSQTITNLIGEALAQGKKILFVAQKMAALEVVKARLDESHLGDAVLELHSHKTNKKALLDSLKSVFEQGQPQSPDRSAEYRRLKEVREYLDGYVADIREPILNSGLTYSDCLGRMLELQKDDRLKPLVRIPFSLLKIWGPEELGKAIRALEAVQDYLVEFGEPEKNSFWLSPRLNLSPVEEKDLRKLVEKTLNRLEQLENAAQSLAEAMRLPEPETFGDVDVLYQAGRRALDAPHLQGVRLTTQRLAGPPRRYSRPA